MCGIAGICNLTRDDAPEESLVSRMLAAIRHRGPDQFGIYLDEHVGLGSARLSILDLAGGQQPITNEDGSLWIVFNGEIFNFLELRRELEGAGHSFRTESDTEVLLHLFEEEGPGCLRKLNGDFAVAIWQARTRELFLARDRVGVRPLFYTMHRGRLLFASEIKALFAEPSLGARIDPVALNQVFTFWSTLTPRTAFQNVHEVPPGCFSIVRNGHLDVHRWWQADFREGPRAATDDQYTEELCALLGDATKLRLRADVPVGAYLSGGLDSSTIAAIVRREGGNRLQTFSIAFEDEQFDESAPQRRMAASLGTEHHVLCAGHGDIARVFPDLIWHVETPILRTAPVPMFLLSGLVREHGYKVVLTGEGADEFFGGYDIFKEAKIRAHWARQPESRRRPMLLRRLYPEIANFTGSNVEVLAAFFGAGLEETTSEFYSHAIRWRNTARARRFFSEDILEAAHGESMEPGFVPAELSVLGRAQWLESTIFLSQYLLCSQGDRPAMAHSVEGRFPFLDYRVIEFGARLPGRLKLRGLTEKYLLRRAAARWLPGDVAARRKQPYRAPIHRSFFHPGAPDYVLDLLSPSKIGANGYFKPLAVSALVEKLRRGLPVGETDDMALAGILSTQLLHECFVEDRRPPSLLPASADVKLCRPELVPQTV